MARTEKQITFADKGNRFAGCHGVVTLALTAFAANTQVVYAAGLTIGRIDNNSGDTITIAIRNATTKEGAANVCIDKAGDPVANITIQDGQSYEFPDGLRGVTYLVLYLDGVTGTGTVAYNVTVSLGR